MLEMNVTAESKKTRALEGIPTGMRQRTPSSRVLAQVIGQAPADYFTVGWLTSTLQRRSFGFIMLFLGLLATIPVGSTLPGLMLAAMAVQLVGGRSEPVFPEFIRARRFRTSHLRRLGGRTVQLLTYFEKTVHPRGPMIFEAMKAALQGAPPPPFTPAASFSESGHRNLARRLVAAGRRAVFVMAIGDSPHPLPILRRCLRHEDAPDYLAVSKYVVVVLVIADRRVFQDQRGHRLPPTPSRGRICPGQHEQEHHDRVDSERR
jgi:hypothetical protein